VIAFETSGASVFYACLRAGDPVKMSDRIVTIIPARMGSSRFPGKPLAPLLGRPMIEHVWRRTVMCAGVAETYVATCDDEIRDVVERLGGQVIMTSPLHKRASDRVAEAAEHVSAEIVVMVQGDEPLITAGMILTAVGPMLKDRSIDCTNLIRSIHDSSEYLDPNTIKVVMDSNHDALYFSRAPIPAIDASKLASVAVYKQVCVIPFRRQFLAEFARLEPTPLECAESIDMLRAIEHGRRVRLVETHVETHAVDTPGDLRRVEALLEQGVLKPMNS
jgi:3-deoxy-manno-octulosonate cytidylyltransferase (CMP-KDO synthetase)